MLRVKGTSIEGCVRCDGTQKRELVATLRVEVVRDGFPELNLSQVLRDE